MGEETRTSAVEAVQQTVRFFETLLRTSADGIILLDAQDNIIIANDAFRSLMGHYWRGMGETRLADWLERSDTGAPQRWTDLVEKARGEGECRNGEFRVATEKGSKYLKVDVVRVKPDVDGEGAILLSLWRDITGEKQMAKELKKAREEAAYANRTRSEFFADMSHEIRTPMNAVVGFSELLSSLITDEKQKGYLESIKRAGRSLLTLIEDILDLSKIEAGRLEIWYEPVNPYTIFNEIRQVFEMEASRKKLEFIVDVDRDLPPALMLDAHRFKQVLLNFLGNAVKLTEKGYVKLSVRGVNESREEGSLDLAITVEDTGIGIPGDQLETVFESYKQKNGQISREYGGTGLGLAVTRRLIEMMNGQVSVNSKIGAGSIFEINFLDVVISRSEAPAPAAEKSFDLAHISFEKARVLVADNVESNRKLIREWLLQAGLEVWEAANGEEVLLLVAEHSPDLIIMDIKMPVMDGFDATKWLKADSRTQDIPVLALTAMADDGDKSRIIEFGFDGYLSKPIETHDFFYQLTRFLKHTKKEEPAEKAARADEVLENLQPGDADTLPRLTGVLEAEMIPVWRSIREIDGVVETEDVEGFAEKLLQLGKEYKVKGLVDYAESLHGFVQNFEVKNTQDALDKFPRMVEEIKTIKNRGEDQ